LTPNRPLDVVILGGGTAGWMAAIGCVSMLPRQQYRVTLVESEEIGIVGVGEATLPQMKNFNDLIAIDEAEMMRATKATFKLGIEFVDWGHVGSCYIHPFGIHGPPASGLPFHHRWLRSLSVGCDWNIEDFSFAIAAARANRFDFPATERPTINSTYSYAYHFDASLYAAYLREVAERRGTERIEGKVDDVEQDPASGDIRALVMESGERVEGDFFIDCSGFRSLLLGSRLNVAWEDWSKWLPCDRALAVPTERQDDLTPYTQSTAMEAGWRWRIPLQHRTGNGYVFSSSFTDEGKAADALLAKLDSAPLADPRLLKFSAGRRKKSWQRNCVALGLASGFLEPLESTSIYLIQMAIMHLLPLMPTGRPDQRLVDEFNRRMDVEYDRIRDFLILHYHLNKRDDAEIWRYCRNMDVPDSLKRKIALFRHSGYIEDYRDGLFNLPSWLSVFLGQGLRPENYHPLVEGIPADRLIDDLEDLRTEIRDRVDEMPKHATFINRFADAHEASTEMLHEPEIRL
jgi:tryptophan halogenase